MTNYKTLSKIIGTLPIFESASRHMSFTKAANELHMSQPAVSRRIANLEELLGVTVFERKHNKLNLSIHGSELLSAVELGLGHINNVISQFGKHRDNSRLTIACGFSFAAMWLQPRFSKFRHLLDGQELHMIASDFPDHFDPESIAIRILWQDNFWPNREVRTLFTEDTLPVCSPAFAARHGIVAGDQISLGKLVQLPLLHYNRGGPKYLDWPAWFQRHDMKYIPEDAAYIFDNYHYTIQAALQGEGIALGYSVLVGRLLANGDLIQIGPRIDNSDSKIFIEFDSYWLDKDTRDKIFDWFSSEENR